MAISDKLNYLIETKQLFKDRLNSLGAEIIESTTFRNYLNWLDTFYNQSSDKTDLAKNGIVGRTSQESTTGKNLLPTNASYWETGHYDSSSGEKSWFDTRMRVKNLIPISPSTTYYVSNALNKRLIIREYNANKEFIYNAGSIDSGNTFTTESNTYYLGISIEITYSEYDETASQLFMCNNNVVDKTYEPYTGGEPSPSPDYPQEINNLSGDVEYKVRGKNLLDKYNNLFQGTFLTTEGGNDSIVSSTMFRCCTKKIDISNLSGDITCSGGYFELFAFYDENNLISYAQDPTTRIPNGTKNVRVRFFGNNTEIPVSTLQQLDLMVENNATVTPYEPYISESFPLSLKSRNLFDGIFRQGTHVSTSTANCLCSTNAMQSTSGNYYTFWTNLPNTYKWKIMNCTTNGTDTTVVNDTNYVTSGSVSVYCGSNGYLKLLVKKTDNSNLTPSDISGYKFQVEKGNQESSYSPYKTPIELCNISDYKDRIYSQNGEFYLEKKTGKIVLDGSENWVYYNTAQGSLFRNNDVDVSISGISPISNYFIGINSSNSRYDGTIYYNYNAIQTHTAFDILTNKFNNAEDFKTWLSTHNTEVQYVLATPTTTEITSSNYPELYATLKEIQDYLVSYKINKEFLLDYSSPEIEY